MDAKTLIKILKNEHPDTVVILASDAEGNSYAMLQAPEGGLKVKLSKSNNEMEFYTEDDIGSEITPKQFEKLKSAIILYPE